MRSKKLTIGTLPAIVAYNVVMKFGVQALELETKLIKSMMIVDCVLHEYEENKNENEEAKQKGMRR